MEMQSIILKNSNFNLKRIRFYQSLSYLRLNYFLNKFENYSQIIFPNLFKTKNSILINQNANILNLEKYFPFFYSVPYRLNKSITWFKNSIYNYQQNESKSGSKPNEHGDNKNRPPPGVVAILLFTISFMILNILYTRQLEELNKKIKEKEKQLSKIEQSKKIDERSTDSNQRSDGPKVSNEAAFGKKTTSAELQAYFGNRNHSLITWNEFATKLLPSGQVAEIIANRRNELVFISLKSPIEMNGIKIYYMHMNVPPDEIERKLERAQADLNIRSEDQLVVSFRDTSFSSNLINLSVFFFICYLLFRATRAFASRMQKMQSDMFSQFGKAKFSMVDPHIKAGAPKISFKDVAGLHEAKVEVKEFVDYLREPERFAKLGAKVPKGALLLGPPGCGKTLLAKAVANEANVPFFSVAGTEFVEMIGGLGASRVRNLFEEARKQSPAIIYIDEIDAIGRKRSDANAMGGGSGEADQTLNQLLVCMDGLESNSNVVVLASTNRADILDKALLRPGRLDRHITIELPTFEERVEILNVHMRNLKLEFIGKEKDEFTGQISHLTPRFSGADLANICNEAALLAARDDQKSITKKNFYHALEKVLGGAEKKNTTISVEDKRLVAYRECGHIIISWFHQYSDLILKVSLLSRTKANAFSQYLPMEKKILSKEELFDKMCLHFGGRVAEQIIFNKFTTSSENDLKKITNLAYAQVESLGMNDVIGNVSFPTYQEEKAQGMVGQKPYSKKLRSLIDVEARKLVSQAHDAAHKTLKANVDKLHKLTEELLRRESLTYQEIVEIIGEPINKSRYNLAKSHLLDSFENNNLNNKENK